MLTLITPTGCRPAAFALCEQMMAAQDYAGPVRWVIVDDGEIAQPVTFARDGWTVDVIRREPFWRPGDNTQHLNMEAALDVIEDHERVVVIEDDDAYLPGYLSAVATWFESAELVGERYARYYHVGRRVWRDCLNTKHASLCSTGATGDALALLREIVARRDAFIDLTLWRSYTGRKALYDSRLTVGTKGLPGRGGIGAGHRMTVGTADPHMFVLQQWLGPMADDYARFRE